MNLKKSANLIGALAWLATALPMAQAAPPADAWAAWSKAHHGGVGVYLAARRGEQWSAPIELSAGTGANVTPALAADSHGRLWVVWSEHEGINSHLMYATVTAGRATPGRAIASPYRSSLSPSIVIDHTGTPWIAWSGYDGESENIFYSRWTGSDWASAGRVNPKNDVPDTQPIMGLGHDGRPWVYWWGFDGQRYSRFIVRWTGSGWTPAQKLPDNNATQQAIVTAAAAAPNLPAQAKGALMANIFTHGGKVQSLPARVSPSNQLNTQ